MTESLFSIPETERETGVSRDTLRAWERRYGFPVPRRNRRGERVYPGEQVERLRLVKQLLDGGMRPGAIVALDAARLQQLTRKSHDPAAYSGKVAELLELLTSGERTVLLPRLETLLREQGVRRFVTDVVAPLNRAVGDAWRAGRLGVLDEHLYAEAVRTVLTAALTALPEGSAASRVLLTTLPGEEHGLGLLMVACLLRLEGAQVLSLGVQTPLDEIVRGATEGGCRIVGISCSGHMGRRAVVSQLVRLRRLLPSGIDLWAGGSGVGAIRSLPGNIRLFTDLNEIDGKVFP